MVFILIFQFAVAQDKVDPVFSFSLTELSERNPEFSTYPYASPNGKEALLFEPQFESTRFSFPGYDEGVPYSSDRYLVIDLEHDNPGSLVLLLEFMRKGDTEDQNGWEHARISVRIGVLPDLPTRIVFPFSYLNAQHVFLPKYPRQLKGTLNGKRMDNREIKEVCIRLINTRKGKYPQHVRILGAYLFDSEPPELEAISEPLVDSLGQWKARDWKGKSKSFDEFRDEINTLESSLEKSGEIEGRSKYLGFLKLRFDSTGFFHTCLDGKRWWLADPSGYAYLSIAPTGVRPFSHGPVEGNEDLYEWLPGNRGSFAKAYATQRGLKSLSFITLNLIRLWGDGYMDRWREYTAKLIASLGFTGSANWSDARFYEASNLPYFYAMSGFPSTEIKLFRDFPDVFDVKYEESAKKYARQLEERKDDPLMIGYFLGNEPHWAFGNFNITREMMYKYENSESRMVFIDWLKEKYDFDPALISASWGYEFVSFQDLEYFIFPNDKDIKPGAGKDLQEFSEILVEKYIATICSATKEADPNHLNLGLRFAWISSPACLQTAKYFDVFSLNGYSFPEPPSTRQITDHIDMPVLIGEFHFGSTDMGLPATGLKGVKSQKDRGKAYRRYVENGFARPEIVGIHYFQWNDQPFTGRFDGENYNIGIIDVRGLPYADMARQIKKTNFNLFRIATGEKRPYKGAVREFVSVYY